MKKIVVIGGGTGTAVVLNALKDLPEFSITAIVVVSDNGGSTGRLRDEFGFLPVGDLRQCIAALASGENEEMIRKLLLYRFDEHSSLNGHNLGNLILTALEDLSTSPGKAIETAAKIFRTSGTVLPISEDNVDLAIEYEDGQIRIGEKNLDDPQFGGKKIKQIRYTQPATIYSKAKTAIVTADIILLGPGDLYGSLLANTLVTGFAEALQQNQQRGGKFCYISNLMTHFSQTNQMTLQDHVREIERYCQRAVDLVLVNTQPIKQDILERYRKMNEFPVIDDLAPQSLHPLVWRGDLITSHLIQAEKNDPTLRSLLRHDKKKMQKVLSNLFLP